jgi:hypothetical protein
MEKFCRSAGHTFIPARTFSARLCACYGTHRRPWSEQDAGRMPGQDALDEIELTAATPRASTSRPDPGTDVTAGRVFHGAVSGRGLPDGDDADDDAIDAWLRFRPATAAGE